MRVLPSDDQVDEPAVGIQVVKVPGATQQEFVFQCALQVAMRAFDRPILADDAGIVARGLHAVVRHQILITLCQVVRRRLVEVSERRRQTVAAMFLRHAAECPQGVLQPLGQRHEAFAAEDDMGMREARERQPEVIAQARRRPP